MTRRKLVSLLATSVTACGLLSGCGFTGLYSASLPGGADLGDHPYSVTVEFKDVLDLVPQSAVKVNDVAVGKVTDITLGVDKKIWVAKVTIAVNNSVKLPANARASILQTSLLGEKYVSLMRPSSGPGSTDGNSAKIPRLKNHDKIPLGRTNSAPGAEQVLGALSLLLNEGGLRQIKAIAIELNKALGTPERQSAARDLIGQLDTFIGTLDNQKTDITNALVSVDKLAATLNRNKKVLTDALDTFPAALRVLSRERSKLTTLLTSLSQFGVVANRVINATQDELVQSLKNLDPVVRSLTASGNDFPEALRIAGTFPFPLGLTRKIVKGDYANLDADVNLELTDTLCGAIGLCAAGASPAAVAKGQAVIGKLLPGLLSTGAAGNSKQAVPLSPMLVGAGK